MPSMTDRRSVAANASSGNVLAGKQFEFVPGGRGAVLEFFITGAAIGLNTTITVGGEVIVNDEEVSSINRFPQDPEDRLAEFGGRPGDRIFVSLRNTTGAAIVGITLVKVTAA